MPGKGSGARRRAVAAACAATVLAALLAACGPAIGGTSGTSGSSPANSDGGTTVTYALEPGGQPSYPFPFMDLAQLQFFSVYNVNDYQYLLYRPLYWFGTSTGSPYLNEKLSLAYPPKYSSNNTVTIRLKKNYKWSNGEPVDAADVVFWMHMMENQGQNGVDWSQTGLPSDVDNVRAAGKYVVTMHITTAQFSETWFTNNELSEITPMPMAWDRTGPSKSDSSNCDSDVNSCGAVYNYLARQAAPKNLSTLASSPIWNVVDGPWKLQSLDQGTMTLAFNTKYSGPVAPGHIVRLIEVPFTSEAAEFNVLQDPTGNQTIDVGYLPTVDAQSPPAGAIVGANARTLSSYHLTAVYPWQLSYFPYNFNNNTGQGAIFRQLYFREAFQYLVDQEGVINGPLHGYGKPTAGPVSSYPVTSYLSRQVESKGDPWVLNIPAAKALLADHGWQVVPNGVDTCVSPGTGPNQCGPHIPAGTKLNFSLQYATGIDYMESGARELASNASLAGIKVNLDPLPFGKVVQNTGACLGQPASKPCTWQLAEWGSWTYSPDYLPTGDTLFEGSSPNNVGGYNDPTDNKLIKDTLTARTQSAFLRTMHTWENYLATQLPVVYEPDTPQLIETVDGLDIGTQNSALNITPEDWRYTK